MKKSVIAASLLLLTGTAAAGECDVSMDGQVSLMNNILTVTTEDNDIIKIDAGETLFVNGKRMDINKNQERWVAEYYNGIYDAVPVAADLALDGVAIANVAVSEVLGNLLGSESNAVEKIQSKLDDVKQKIEHNFYAEDGSIHLDSADFSDGEFFGAKWEQEFEDTVEEVVTASIGHLMIALGTELIFGDGDTNDFDQRMDNFGQNIEQKIEARADKLEQKADAFCMRLAKIDNAENKLQNSMGELSGLNLITVKSDRKM
ncbi:YggN family protein [Aliiglaciecola sp. 3_MG-2023]|uniref:YggN family protein n=1 Tax=Aliiglaciecola sp. 3_MG-2023 TaxID=3062644 RepID=UPI0026E1F4E3|nr:YggN family protein [Aliiglaciecola sp. 3_MG-2023]MDO6692167.1 YggN family protein [Aliiglaciecola sp. 3_MG-2023]